MTVQRLEQYRKLRLDLGDAMARIPEWQPVDFSSLGPFEICLLAALGLTLWRGIVLSPTRVLLVLGLLHMALSHVRSIEVFALLAPLVLGEPLSARFGRIDSAPASSSVAGIAALLIAVSVATWAFASNYTFTPMRIFTPVKAVELLKERKTERILHNAGFGGYLITQDIPVFFDGRGELYGSKFLVKVFDALALNNVDSFLDLLESYKIDATLLTPSTPAVGLMDRLDGWKRIYADDLSVVHARTSAVQDDVRIKTTGDGRP